MKDTISTSGMINAAIGVSRKKKNVNQGTTCGAAISPLLRILIVYEIFIRFHHVYIHIFEYEGDVVILDSD